ncbi:MAG: phosphatidylglycerol lysyltransferase domain-containing protein, partial [bacterium]
MNTIPLFPDFKDIELSDKTLIKAFTSKFPPYSDYNFTAIWSWSWDVNKKVMISQLNNNLVILFKDYVSDQRFLSFIGNNQVPKTALQLIAHSEKYFNTNLLRLIPEEVVRILPEDEFVITADRNSYDYIYSVPDLANMNTWPQNSIRKSIRKFIKKYPNYIIKQSSIKEVEKTIYLDLFKKWSQNKDIENFLEFNELKAFKKFFDNHDDNIKIVSLYINNILVGFNTYEIISKDYANSSFSKADTEYDTSIYSVLNWEEAKILNKEKITYYNWEQDLGIPGLRYSKEKYKQAFFLKKFTV